jgi:hypothetical protein
MKYLIIKMAVLSSMLLMFTAGTLNADTVRRCKSYYELQYLSINDTPIQNGQKIRFNEFESRGHCGNLVPKRCRERARGHAQDCIKKHWETRWAGTRPGLCSNSKGVEGYNLQDIKKRLEFMTCCSSGVPATAQSNWSKVVVSLRGITMGKRGCPGQIELTGTYTIDCTKVAAGFKACGGE